VFGNIGDTAVYFDIYWDENTYYKNVLSQYGKIKFATSITNYNLSKILISTTTGLYVMNDNGLWQVSDISPDFYTKVKISGKIYMTDDDKNVYIFDPAYYTVTPITQGFRVIKFMYNK
jgi:hypothetical protein